ncbi:MAG: GNAT family N-acetyltransferase [Alphaproteobacteria bacterium]|nr:GNAT family N-acetyltransferase [Alphaproteobacteria bacterium]
MNVTVEALTGQPLLDALPEVARLRIAVFREWPYLYDGTIAYERRYIDRFPKLSDAVIVAAFADGRLVGSPTGEPLLGQHPEFVAPFVARGYDAARVFYCGESVLLPGWRGQGVGHDFFDRREAHARALGGLYSIAFCAVVRAADDPRRPANARDLGPFWRRRGYAPVDGRVTSFDWREVGGGDEEVTNRTQFWLRPL